MTKRTWHRGAPPSVGWWPASITKNPNSIRWWDGKVWSQSAYPYEPATVAAQIARHKSAYNADVRWCERWWV